MRPGSTARARLRHAPTPPRTNGGAARPPLPTPSHSAEVPAGKLVNDTPWLWVRLWLGSDAALPLQVTGEPVGVRTEAQHRAGTDCPITTSRCVRCSRQNAVGTRLLRRGHGALGRVGQVGRKRVYRMDTRE